MGLVMMALAVTMVVVTVPVIVVTAVVVRLMRLVIRVLPVHVVVTATSLTRLIVRWLTLRERGGEVSASVVALVMTATTTVVVACTTTVVIIIALSSRAVRLSLYLLLYLFYVVFGHDLTSLRMLHCNLPLVEGRGLVHTSNSIIGLLAALEKQIGEASRRLGVEILYDVYLKDTAIRRENLTQVVLRGALWNASHIDVAVVIGIDHIVVLVNDDLLALLLRTLLHLILLDLDVEMLDFAVFFSITFTAHHSLQLWLFWVVIIVLGLKYDTRITHTFLSNSIWTL